MNRMDRKTFQQVKGVERDRVKYTVHNAERFGSHSVEVCWLCNGMNYDAIFQ
jgi:hypothetical protein